MPTMPTLKDRVVCLDPSLIQPVHGPDDPEALAVILASMKEAGWQGRPLVVMKRPSRPFQALTGSHRLAAAQEVPLGRIPVILLHPEEAQSARASEGWDPHLDIPINTDMIASELERSGHKPAGYLIRMDEAARTLEMTVAGAEPWSPEALEFYRKAPFGRHPQIQAVMAVRDWEC